MQRLALGPQSDAKVTHRRGEGEIGEGSSKSRHVQLRQLLAGTHPDELGFGGVKPQPIRRHPRLEGHPYGAHDLSSRKGGRDNAVNFEAGLCHLSYASIINTDNIINIIINSTKRSHKLGSLKPHHPKSGPARSVSFVPDQVLGVTG